MIAVYFKPRNRDRAESVIRRLRDEGHQVRAANAEYFESDQLEPVDVVYHDGTEPLVPEAYGPRGIDCESFAPRRPTSPGPGSGYHVERSGSWYKLIGPAGEQIGKSQRTEDDAWALAGGVD